MLRKLFTQSGSGGVSSVTVGLSSVGPPPTLVMIQLLASAIALRQGLDPGAPKRWTIYMVRRVGRVLTISIALFVLAWVPQARAMTAPVISYCGAGKQLLAEDDVPGARAQFEAALEQDATRLCGVEGLGKARKQAAKDARISISDVWHAIRDWLLNVSWPWLIGFAVVRLGLGLFRGYVRRPSRISVSAPAEQKEFAKAVIEAASAAGEDGRRALKLMTAADAALPSSTITDVSKLLGLPASVPLQAIVDLAIGSTLANRLEVSCAIEGGWATAELVLRHPGHQRIRQRIAVPLGAIEEKSQEVALALVAGAWLIAVEDKDESHGKTPQARLAYALFRAGAYLQSTGDFFSAIACYTAMPEIDLAEEPLAWTGSRMNTVAILGLARLTEARAIAARVHTRLKGLQAQPGESPPIDELRLRAQYITACLWVDAENVEPGLLAEIGAIEPADEAAAEIAELSATLGASGDRVGPGERAAMKLTVLTHEIKAQSSLSVEEIDELRRRIGSILMSATEQAAAASAEPPLTAAAYYDAGCAYSLLAAAAAAIPNQDLVKELAARARLHLRTAFDATPAAQRPRFTSLAEADPTLTFVRTAEGEPQPQASAAFETAIGHEPSAGPQMIDTTLHIANA
jgi:hypothetical protein